jgi:hypothetical protein
MLFRAIALTLALLIGIGTIIPLGTDNAEAGPRKSRKYKKQKKYKKYSIVQALVATVSCPHEA